MKPATTTSRLTNTFADLWERHIGERDETSPTFHEIRALGARLYKNRGINPQTLLGHTDPNQTLLYLEGHAKPWIETEIPAVSF
ncbi:MAG: hypothetical protein GEV05_26210 [Betaproteobacteria bacterium]|nr:hypothetical protein [Betaproteobacteria bacterium]